MIDKRTLEVELIVVAQSDYETVLTALRDYIRLSDAKKTQRDGWSPNDPDDLRLAEIRKLAATARPKGNP